MSTIAVVGIGAIGGVLAAHLCAAGQDVVLCARRQIDELILETLDGTLKIAPPVLTRPGDVEPTTWVLLATKAHQTPGAAGWLRALATTRTTLVILQNGVEHEERVRAYANGAALLPAIVDCRAEKIGPGQIIQRTPAEIVVPDTEAGRAFAALCDGTAMRVQTTVDFATVAWRKLCVNVAGGAITALTDRPLGVVRRADVAEVARDLIRECIVVGRAEGARLEDALADEIVATMIYGPPEAGTSMLADRRLGRALEADARNGAVARIGRRHRIPTPLNTALTALLAAIHTEP